MKKTTQKSRTIGNSRRDGHPKRRNGKRAPLIFADIDAYLHKVTPGRDRTLRAMEQYAGKHGFPIIGPLVGRILYQLAAISGARHVLELGSGFGYSAYWFAQAMGNQGRITMTDTDAGNRERAFKYFKRGDIKSRVTFILDDALNVAGSLSGPYDIILNDIDKKDYPKTIDIAARLLRPGGLFITDNIIWDGRVYDSGQNDADTRGIRRFTRMLFADERFFTTVMPVRDGITVARRL